MRTTTLWTLIAAAGLATAATAQDTETPRFEPLPTRCGTPSGSPTPVEITPQPEAARPRVEVAFVLDTTGSMGGLIEGAKAKIWSIANAIATSEPAPEIRMALVGYRDRHDEYVTKRTDLTSDLDAIYADLMGYAANGGGDSPESVNQALREAVNDLDWSDDDAVLKIIYLVGDAPPHMDYEQDVLYPATCEAAARAGIIINTIQCGTMGSTTPIWQEIARLSEGEYFAIDQSGGMMAVATPFDAELAELSRELDATMVAYGTPEQQAALGEKLERGAELVDAAEPEAAADRAAYKSTAAGLGMIGQELVKDLEEGRVALEDLDEKELPAVMQPMSQPEREAYVAEQATRRAEATKRIQSLNEQRQAFLKEKLEEAGQDGFDQRVLESYRRQAAERGIIGPSESDKPEEPEADTPAEEDEDK